MYDIWFFDKTYLNTNQHIVYNNISTEPIINDMFYAQTPIYYNQCRADNRTLIFMR